MHNIQRKILLQVALGGEVSFSEAQPEGIANNLYDYHLKKLVSAGLVEKSRDTYRLTTKGKSYVDRLTFTNLSVRQQPKIVSLLSVTNNKNQLALYERLHEPYINQIGYPTGKLHLGETITQAAKREAEEKLGLDADPTHLGDCYVIIRDGSGEIISHILAHISQAKVEDEPIDGDLTKGRSFWGNFDDFKDSLMPGTLELSQLISSGEKFFEELSYTVGNKGDVNAR